MRKKGLKVIIILILLLITCTNISYGVIIKDYSSKILIIGWEPASKQKILEDLKEAFGYDGIVAKEIKIKTKITIVEQEKSWFGLGNNKYKLRFR